MSGSESMSEETFLAELVGAGRDDPETIGLLLHGSRAAGLDALLRLVRDGDSAFQQQLEDCVEQLMASRGIAHEWGNELEPLKTLPLGTDP